MFIEEFNTAFESKGCKIGEKTGGVPVMFYDSSSIGDGQRIIMKVVGDPYFIDGDTIIDSSTNYYLYSEWFSECVTPDSKIMVGKNKETKLAKDVEENDEIAYYDFSDNVVKIGTVSKVYIHRNATNFVKYIFEDGSYLEATDYHPIYTKEGWKSLTNRNGYETPQVGDEVKAEEGWKKLMKIETYTGKEDCYDFGITSEEGIKVDNYFANGTLVQGSY